MKLLTLLCKVENTQQPKRMLMTVASIKRQVGYGANDAEDVRASKRDRIDVDVERQGLEVVAPTFPVHQVGGE